MVDDVLSVAKTLLSVQQRFLKSSQERREQISGYFRNISKCLKDISSELQASRIPFGKCAELETYASELAMRIGEEIGMQRAAELAGRLSTAAMVRGAVAGDLSSIDALGPKIAKLEEASGVFEALANSVVLAPRSRDKSPLYLTLAIVFGLAIYGLYRWQGERVDEPAQAHKPEPAPNLATNAPKTEADNTNGSQEPKPATRSTNVPKENENSTDHPSASTPSQSTSPPAGSVEAPPDEIKDQITQLKATPDAQVPFFDVRVWYSYSGKREGAVIVVCGQQDGNELCNKNSKDLQVTENGVVELPVHMATPGFFGSLALDPQKPIDFEACFVQPKSQSHPAVRFGCQVFKYPS